MNEENQIEYVADAILPYRVVVVKELTSKAGYQEHLKTLSDYCAETYGEVWSMDNPHARWYSAEWTPYPHSVPIRAETTLEFWFLDESDAMLFSLKWM
jgi:hypothetical protein